MKCGRSTQIYRYSGQDANPWVGIPGQAVDIGAAAAGTVWHVAAAGAICRYAGDQLS
ncbi:hypothetical protein [Streptomyces sp. NPDC006552]|uniref:hypothetical protein n=1 Tax=Streptomyces sp. NPDC006552 TaxID=3157179 RepID=UPI0033B20B7D